KLQPAAGVTATGLDTTSADVTGIDFSTLTTNIVTITGMVKDSTGTGVEGVKVWADEVAYAGSVEGDMTGVSNSTKTDANGSYTLKIASSTPGVAADATRFKVNAWDPNTGDLTPLSGVDGSANVTGQHLTLSTSRTVTIDIQNAPSDDLLNIDDTTGYYMDKAFLDIYSPTADKGNEKKITDADLSDTSDGSLSIPEGSGYRAKLHIPGYGEFEATENGSTGFAVSGGNTTIHFDLQRDSQTIAPIEIAGTVTDSDTNALSNAYISVINEDTYEIIGEMTDSSGDYSLKVPNLNPDGTEASYKVRVDKPGYSSPTAEETVAVATTDADFTMPTNSSTITGTVYSDAARTTVATEAEVMAQEVGAEGFARTRSDSSDGTFTLNVAPSKTWNIVAKSKIGYIGQKLNQTSGTTGLQVVLTNQINTAEAGKLNTDPTTQQIKPADGGIINDVDNSGVKLTIPEEALGDSSSYVPVKVQEIASVPETTDFKPLGGVGKEITSTQAVESDITVEFVFDKSETEAMTETTSANNTLSQLSEVQNVYWDDLANNYVQLATTRTAETKADSSDTWTPTDWDTFVDAIDDSDGDGAYDTYYDYKISLTSDTNHFTVFGLKTGSDTTAPSTPTGLAATSGNGSIALAWTANTEADLMEYEVYRNTSAGVSVSNTYQINSSQVATNSYTDSSAVNWTSYYYIITAADSSRNESSASSEVQVCPHPTVSNGTVADDCTLTCSGGYNISGYTCVPGGSVIGGGGGASTEAETTLETKPGTLETTDAAEETTTAETTTETPAAQTLTEKIVNRAQKIVQIIAEAKTAVLSKISSLLSSLGITRNIAQEKSMSENLVSPLLLKANVITKEMQYATTNFITYGTETTKALGEGERAGVLNSFHKAYNRLPENDTDWQDAIKIANGRFPAQQSIEKEKEALKTFIKIYKRLPDFSNGHDEAALKIVTYGIRPTDRNLDSEKAAIKSFENIYGEKPVTTTDWDIMRAVAYSGASR
ncbi:carboxypeptidase regulatory-like domain-containing protein, partial [Patescibacteria group bacterium]